MAEVEHQIRVKRGLEEVSEETAAPQKKEQKEEKKADK